MKNSCMFFGLLAVAATARGGNLGQTIINSTTTHSITGPGIGTWTPTAGALDSTLYVSENAEGKMPSPNYGTYLDTTSAATASLTVMVKAYWYATGPNDPPPSLVEVYTNKNTNATCMSSLIGSAYPDTFKVETKSSGSPSVSTSATVSGIPSTSQGSKFGLVSGITIDSVTWHATSAPYILESDQTWTYTINSSVNSHIQLPLPYAYGTYMQGNSLATATAVGTIRIGLVQ